MKRRLSHLNALRAFESAARNRSFARAAEELHVTPAAISQQIKQLEAYLGITLFRRGKGIDLSESAEAALPLLSEAFDRMEQALVRLRNGNDAGPLVVSAPPNFAARWLVPKLDDFQTRHPEIELHLNATRRLVDFDTEEVDVAIRFGDGNYSPLHCERLMDEAIVPVASPILAAGIRKPSDLLGCALLQDDSQQNGSGFPDWQIWLASLGVSGPMRIRHFGDPSLTIQGAVTGLGIALAWRSLVVDDLRAGRLVQLYDSMLPTDHGYHFVTQPKRLQVKKIAAFRNWILHQAALIPEP